MALLLSPGPLLLSQADALQRTVPGAPPEHSRVHREVRRCANGLGSPRG